MLTVDRSSSSWRHWSSSALPRRSWRPPWVLQRTMPLSCVSSPACATSTRPPYLLDNGFYRTVFSQEPVHFKDASGIWQAIDTTLAAGKQGEFVTRAAPVAVTISPTASEGRSTVALSGPAGPVGLDLIGASRASLAVTGSEAGLSGVLTRTDLTYAATGDGLKETLVLRSAEAPAGFTFRLTHPGYTLRQEEGQWGLYAAGESEPAFVLGALSVFDASADEGDEPAWCDGAAMIVAPARTRAPSPTSCPRAWLADPARVWPGDHRPQPVHDSPTDTYISSGYPNTAYGPVREPALRRGLDGHGHLQTLVRFPQVDNRATSPTDAHVCAAIFSIRQYWQPSTPNDTHPRLPRRRHLDRLGRVDDLELDDDAHRHGRDLRPRLLHCERPGLARRHLLPADAGLGARCASQQGLLHRPGLGEGAERAQVPSRRVRRRRLPPRTSPSTGKSPPCQRPRQSDATRRPDRTRHRHGLRGPAPSRATTRRRSPASAWA